MKKRILVFLLSVVMVMGVFPQISFAETVASGTCGDNLTWTLDGEGVLLISGNGAMTDYEYENAPWYSKRYDIKKAVILDGVTSIGYGAFSYCTYLTSVTIPVGVTSIGDCAFASCWVIENIVIPDSVTVIGNNSFDSCLHLKSVIVGSGVTSIGHGAFYDCSRLESITIPNGVTFIGNMAFCYCESLTDVYFTGSENEWRNIEKSDNDELENAAIHYNRSEDLPETTYIGYCGADNNNLKWLLDTETGVLTISGSGDMADDERPWNDYMNYVETVIIAEGVTSIGTYAFYWCGMTDIAIPASLTSIGDGAFNFCENLENITIPAGVTYISEYAFLDCTALSSINVDSGNNSYCSIDGVLYSKDLTSLVAYPKGKTAEEITIPDGVTAIGASLFANCYTLKKIVIPASVTVIGYAAFQYCESLESITIPAGVTAIDDNAFEGCRGLTSINVDNANNNYCSIDGVLYNKDVTSLLVYPKGKTTETFTIPAGIISINDGTFSNCDNLTSVTIPAGVTSIGASAFNGCYNLNNIAIPDSVTSIGEYAFDYTAYYNDSSNWENNVLYIDNHLIKADNYSGDCKIKAGTKTIAGGAFSWCGNLTSVTVPDSVTLIGNNAFYDCSRLESVTISYGVTSIGSEAFAWCGNLTSVTVPDSVVSIGSNAFYGSAYYSDSSNWQDNSLYIGNHLIYVEEPGTTYAVKSGTKTIADSAFVGWCADMTSISIPDSLVYIGSSAFAYCYNLTSVLYAGNEEDWKAIKIKDTNENLVNAQISYGVKAPVASGICGDNLTWTLDDEGTLTIRGTGSMYDYTGWYGAPWVENIRDVKNVIIQSGVTSIGNYAFYCCTALTNVTIADTVETIGKYAFCYCPELPEITIPGGVSYIGDWALSDNYKLTAINVDERNLSYSSADGVLFDKDKTTLILFPKRKEGNYTIPNTVTTIKSYAFNLSLGDKDSSGGTTAGGSNTSDSFVGLTALTIPSSVITIEDYTFYGCNDLISITVDEGNGNYSSADGVLFNKDKTNIILFPGGKGGIYTVPVTVTTIGDNAFCGNEKLTNVTLQNGVESIGYSAFAECTSLVSVSMPNSVMAIGNYAFDGCMSLTGMVIPENIKEIGHGTFNMCSGLQGIAIPNSVKTIGDYAFSDCTALENVYYSGSDEEWGTITIGSYYNNDLTTANRYYGGVVAMPSLNVSDKGEVTLTVAYATGTETVFVAVYDVNGGLLETKQVKVADGVGIDNVSMTGVKTIKAFVWNLSNIKPLSTPAIREIK